MQKKQTSIGLGTWSFGGDKWSHGWGFQNEKESEKVIIKCLENGIGLIDTAPAYGIGKAEEIIGKSITKWRGTRPFLSTKCGQQPRIDGHGFVTNHSKEFIREEISRSLKRLNVDYLDLVFLHYPSQKESENFEALEELNSLITEGKINNIGLSNFDHEKIKKINNYFKINAIQFKYSMLDRIIDENIINLSKLNNIRLYGYQPLESGLLTGSFFREKKRSIGPSDWRSRSSLFKKESIDRLHELNTLLAKLACRFDVSIATISLSWALQSSNLDTILVGIRSVKQLQQLIKYKKVLLTLSDLKDIDNLTLKKIV